MKTPTIDQNIVLVIDKKGKDTIRTSKIDTTFKVIGLVFVYIFLLLVAFFALLPFYWMILTSLKYQDIGHFNIDNTQIKVL